MTVEEIEAIVGGYHGDAFRILGPHSVRRKGGQARWEVRAFLPQAESAGVIIGAERVAMSKQHARGFFVASLTGDPARRARRHEQAARARFLRRLAYWRSRAGIRY